MKKFLVLCLLAVLTAALLTAAASAEGAQISCPDISAQPGETVTLTLSLSENPGIAAMRLRASYDTEQLTLLSAEDQSILPGLQFVAGSDLTQSPFTVVWAGASNSTGNGILLTLTFRVAEDAEPGFIPVVFTAEGMDQTYASVPLTGCTSQVQILPDASGVTADWDAAARTVRLEQVDARLQVMAALYQDGRMTALRSGTTEDGTLTFTMPENAPGTELRVFLLLDGVPVLDAFRIPS